MFRIISKSIHSSSTTSKPHKLFIFRIRKSSSSSINVYANQETSSSSINIYANQESFTIAYLLNEFGFSLQRAVLAAKNVRFKNRDKPDAVVSFFKNQGFTQTQIKQVISINARLLIINPQKILLPKFLFFRSKGFSKQDLVKIIVCNPGIIARSLNNHILPSFHFFRDWLGSDESVVYMLNRNVSLFSKVKCHVKPNIEVLTQAGVPYSNISYLLKYRYYFLASPSGKLNRSLEQVLKMGMNPRSSSFSIAVSILTVTSRSRWNEKMEAFERWGCSEDEVLASFRISPWIMATSEEKIDGVMGFCVHDMGWEPSEVVRRYYLFALSLNTRMVPRWSVYKELVSKGLVKKEGKVNSMFTMKEEVFLEKYVHRYKDEAPSLLKLYFERLEASQVQSD